jgi:3-dehydroquinate synthase
MEQTVSFIFHREVKSTLSLDTISCLATQLKAKPGLVIMDAKVWQIYQKHLCITIQTPLLLLEAGEKSKSLATVAIIYSFLSEHHANRNSIIYVLGGGTITDTAAYAVSTFKRGCRLILIPTTLVGMVDASLGGKTSINMRLLKNDVGTFFPAEEILLIPEFQTTLPETELQNGLAEMLKLWFIDQELSLPQPDKQKLISSEQLFSYAEAKMQICTKDTEDRSERRLLNLGHTFGHLLESVSRYRIPHGKAVAQGISIAIRLSCRLGFLETETAGRMERVLIDYGFGAQLDSRLTKAFLEKAEFLIGQDKKSDERGLVLVLFRGYRQVFIKEALSLEAIVDFLSSCI